MARFCSHLMLFLGKSFLCFALLLMLGKCGLASGIIDWRLAAQSSLLVEAFPKVITGEYLARSSRKFLPAAADCSKKRLIIQKKFLSFLCGPYILAYCVPKLIRNQGKNYEILCDSSFPWEYPAALKEPKLGIAKPQYLWINYISQDRIVIVNDFSHSINQVYKRHLSYSMAKN